MRRIVDQAWREMKDADRTDPAFDVLYVSYAEARHGAPKELISKTCFVQSAGFGSCLDMYSLGKVLKRCFDFFRAAAQLTYGSITSSARLTCALYVAQ